MTQTMDKMSVARSRMLIKHVFWASLLLKHKMVRDEKCPTAYTDMSIIGYNPTFIEKLDLDVVLFVIAHEVAHIMFKHGLRRQHRNPKRWNIACDFAINSILKKAGFVLWEFCLYDAKYEGMSAEQIYDIREKEREERRKKKGKDGDDGKPGNQPGQGRGQPPKGRRGEGAGDYDGLDDDFDMDDLHEPNLDPDERAKREQEIQQHIAEAATFAKMAGKLSGEMERLLGKLLDPPLPWPELLREWMTAITTDDESWVRRNRRITDYVLPSRYSEACGPVAIIGDTSGSMGAKELNLAAKEITAVVEMVKPECTYVVWADDKDACHEEQFDPGDDIVLHPKGGGGTDMRKPLKYVEKYEPSVVVLITDGCTPWPDFVEYPLIVLCTTKAPVPDIGRTIRVYEGV